MPNLDGSPEVVEFRIERVKKLHSVGAETVILTCKVTPNARQSACCGWEKDAQGRDVLLVKLAAAPVDGRANAELVRFIAEMLGCRRSEVRLARGDTSRLKALRIPASLAAKLPK